MKRNKKWLTVKRILNKKIVNSYCQPKSGILRFLACGTHLSCDTLVFRGESSYYYFETCVLNFLVCEGVPCDKYQMVNPMSGRKALF